MEHCTICDIVHDRGETGCPLCEADEEIHDLKSQIDDLEDEVSELEE